MCDGTGGGGGVPGEEWNWERGREKCCISYLPEENCAIHNVLLYKITANKIYVAILYVDVNLNDSAGDAADDFVDFGGGNMWCDSFAVVIVVVVAVVIDDWSAAAAAFFLFNLLRHCRFMLDVDVSHALEFDIVDICILFRLFF